MKLNHIYSTNIDEVDYYARILSSTEDPIKKKILDFHQLTYIFSKLKSFPISKAPYYDLKNECAFERIFKKYIALSYVVYRQITSDENIKIEFNDRLSSLIEDFICRFYAYESPIKDLYQQEVLWIYPRLQYKYFLTDCMLLGNHDDYYVDISTIEEIVQIMAGFTRYEFDQTLAETNYQVNFPSLIFANIKLYEKGYLEVVEEHAGVEIKLNLKPNSKAFPAFSRNSYILKRTIIDMCKKSYNEHYSYKDFK
ncbi:MAG: hypothetical protein K0R93_2804 [Anaerosolibacter sp.]|jgi:hypothetical protein|uniref:hypothetical protein n=1 Tax=Anaerosolibacter sp. TaxID=1872527 RepID=UPI0026355EE9|nr:hypothetical protein [Anaerosolibacter sp.]MDF2547906.1 hypothetical protein [Anaerosolibacter sp.]